MCGLGTPHALGDGKEDTMKTTTAMLLGLAGLITLAGCGSSNPDQPADTTPSGAGLQCGSDALFAQIHDECGAMDADGAPGADGIQCRCLIGYEWTGSECLEVTGCECHGDDCDKLTETKEACEANHAACVDDAPVAPQGFTCGSSSLYAYEHDACEAMDAKAAPDENGDCFCMLGYAWDGDSCEMLANCQCVGEDCDKLTETQEACEQEHAACGGDVAEPLELTCGSPDLFAAGHDACAAMDATAVPDQNGQSCYCFLGYAWNGSACVGLADCACAGEDCDKLTTSQEECEQAHAGC